MTDTFNAESMSKLSNQQFLEALFSDRYVDVHVTGFPDDPGSISSGRRGICWAGGRFSEFNLKEGHNQYYAVSLFTPDFMTGRSVRRKAHHIATYVIGLDDVKEKLPLEQVSRLPPPSIVLKSSLHSEQWLYILASPETNKSRLDNLHDQLIANGLAPDGNDPGQKGVTRYLRLPEGFNTKAKRMEENGGTAPQCEVVEWNPHRRYTMEQLAEPFNVDLDAPRQEGIIDGATTLPDHPLLKYVTVKSLSSPGRFDITCPWVGNHTDGSDDGAVIFTNFDGSGGFNCFHGHCIDKSHKDVVEWIEAKNPGFKQEYNHWKTLHAFAHVAAQRSDVIAVSSNDSDFSKYSLKGRSGIMKAQMLEEKFVVGRIAILGQYTVIYAPPNAGKTLIIMREICNGIRSGEVDAEKVFYINADDNFNGLVTKLEIAEQCGFHMLAPGHLNFEAKELVVVLSSMVQRDTAKGVVVILDTLKKFTDLMDKKNSSDFNSMIRAFISKGGTVIALAHVNKHQDADGKSVHAGTTDVKDDSDCVYIANVINDIGDKNTVEFINEKSRGNVAAKATYTYIKKDGMPYRQIFDSVAIADSSMAIEALSINKKAQSAQQNCNVIDAIKYQISANVTKKTEIVTAVHCMTGESSQRIRKVLDFHQGTASQNYEYWQCQVGDRNVHVYSLNKEALTPEASQNTNIPSFL